MTLTETAIILTFLLSLGFSALFSGLETAIISINKVKIHHHAEQGDKGALRLVSLLEKIEILISSCLIGNNITIIVASVMVGTFLSFHNLNEHWFALVAVPVETTLFLIFGEIFPKALFRSKANQILLKLYPFLEWNLLILKPVLILVDRLNSRMFRRKSSKAFSMTREEIENLFHISSQEGIIDNEGSDIISDVLDFRDTTAREIIVPTINIISCEIKRPLSQAAKLIQDYGYSRIPIFDKRVDNIIGYVSARSLLNYRKNDTIEKVMQKAQYIPLTKKISEAYIEMKSLGLALLFVVNEYGAVAGMISLEDIVEEIIGEIQSLDHPEESSYEQVDDKSFVLDGIMNIDDVNKIFHTTIEKKGFETIGGYMTFRFDKIPLRGESITLERVTITAEEVTATLVKKVRLEYN